MAIGTRSYGYCITFLCPTLHAAFLSRPESGSPRHKKKVHKHLVLMDVGLVHLLSMKMYVAA